MQLDASSSDEACWKERKYVAGVCFENNKIARML